MNKKLVSEFFVDEKILKSSGRYYPVKLDYYKTEEICEETSEKLYGIEIVKTEYQYDIPEIETAKFYNLCSNENRIDEVLEIFRRNEVTAFGAEDIIVDLF